MIKAGQDALEKYGAGLSSVRFICGTQVSRYQYITILALQIGKTDSFA